MFDSRWITVVSGRASDLKCTSATLVQVRVPVLLLEIKTASNFKVSHKALQALQTINEREFFILLEAMACHNHKMSMNIQYYFRLKKTLGLILK